MPLNTNEILDKILKDRERRFALRKAMTERGLSSISLNFNIPGYPKSSSIIQNAFKLVRKELLYYLGANRIHCHSEFEEFYHSNCGDFFLQGVSYIYTDKEVKGLLELFEQTHSLGRLLDIDLVNSKGELISSGKQKSCFLCESSAKECMKAERHSFEAYQNYVKEKIIQYLDSSKKKEVVTKIVQSALQATLLEVATEGKPGLVCPSSNGAHSDMDFFTFLDSSAALVNYWRETANLGYDTGKLPKEEINFRQIRTTLRVMGMRAEESMFEATKGVNTQKGIIFLIGLGCFSAGFVFSQSEIFSDLSFRKCVKDVMQGVVEEDFSKGLSQQGTHGEVAFKTYGKILAGGARYEAEQGFPSVFEYTLEFLNKEIEKEGNLLNKEKWRRILTDLLLLIISKSNDINILYRKNLEALRDVQKRAFSIIEGASINQKEKELKEFSEYCISENISPGGAADLLALTLFISFVQKLDFTSFSTVLEKE